MHRSERTNRMCPGNRLHAGLRQSPSANLAFTDEFSHHACHLFDGHFGVNAVQIIEVNIVRFKPLERTFKRTADGFRTRIEPLLAINNLDAAFGSDDRLLAQSFQSFAHK